MNGILIIDKPASWTSHDVVARVRRLLRERRVGHTGTLDPFATGVLVVMVGRATRLAQFLAGDEKEYEAVMRLGYATETGDLTGKPRDTVRHVPFTRPELERALVSLRGEIEQVPPMYSAKKVAGEKLYELARRGEEIERRAVRVCVREFELLDEGESPWTENPDGTRDVRVRVACSAGTYVRVLAEACGEHLGVGAHLSALRRTRAGAFSESAAVSLEELQRLGADESINQILISPDAALSAMPFVHLTEAEAVRTRHGAPVRVGAETARAWPDRAHVRMRDAGGNLLAIGVYEAGTLQLRARVGLCADENKH